MLDRKEGRKEGAAPVGMLVLYLVGMFWEVFETFWEKELRGASDYGMGLEVSYLASLWPSGYILFFQEVRG